MLNQENGSEGVEVEEVVAGSKVGEVSKTMYQIIFEMLHIIF